MITGEVSSMPELPFAGAIPSTFWGFALVVNEKTLFAERDLPEAFFMAVVTVTLCRFLYSRVPVGANATVAPETLNVPGTADPWALITEKLDAFTVDESMLLLNTTVMGLDTLISVAPPEGLVLVTLRVSSGVGVGVGLSPPPPPPPQAFIEKIITNKKIRQ
jgi:hypothetical protein